MFGSWNWFFGPLFVGDVGIRVNSSWGKRYFWEKLGFGVFSLLCDDDGDEKVENAHFCGHLDVINTVLVVLWFLTRSEMLRSDRIPRLTI